ncbi:MAG: hypothetical protein FWD54_00005, partial [Endomicrobia bacterium]|nr:hypothetical protein [Endomicrobiia bacterium]
LNITGTNALTFNGQVSGSGTINKSGSGTLNITGNESVFTGTFNQSLGTTVISSNTFAGRHNITGGILEFATGAQLTAGSSYSVIGSTLNITGTNALTFTGQVSGSGTINKSGSGTLNITGNESVFTGTFNQSLGTTIISSSTFAGRHNITGGILEFATGVQLTAGSSYAIGGTLNITGTNALTFNGQVSGNGTINKSGSGTLNITGNESVFTGTFNQSLGTTVISSNTFAGRHNITGGILEFATGAQLTAGSSYVIGSTLNITGTNALAFNGQVSGSGTINKSGSGTLNISGNESVFTGTFNQSAGTATVSGNTFAGQHNITGGILEFATGAQLTAGSSYVIGSTLNITGTNVLTFTGHVSGSGTINKSGSGTLNITGNESVFTGTFNQSLGTTVISSNTFAGQHNITGGILEFATGAQLTAGSSYSVIGSTLNITGTNALTFSGQVSGSGTINKSGSGTLNITGNESVFTGTFNQTSGLTTVYDTGKMFTGLNSISNSALTVYGAASAASMGYNVRLGNNGISNYYSQNAGVTGLSIENITFNGTGAKANFYNSGGGDYAYYLLNSSFTASVAGNSVNFSNSYVSFMPSSFSGYVGYSFNNSVVDITNQVSNSTRTISFDTLNLTGSNNSLSFGIIFSSTSGGSYSMDTDKLRAVSGSGVFGSIFDVKVYYGEEIIDLNGIFNRQVLYGGLTFATNISSFTLGMGKHTYIISVDTGNWQNINVSIAGGVFTLYDYNAGTVGADRRWVWGESRTYYIDQELGTTAPGIFAVSGDDNIASKWVVSGKINNGSTYGSFFKITNTVNASSFTLENITITQASAVNNGTSNGSGSVLYMNSSVSEAIIRNVILADNNSYVNGGAIYMGAGKLAIEDTIFSGNSTQGLGGAIYLAAGSSSTFNGNISFVSNNSVTGGGAIYATGAYMSFSGSSISFINNGSNNSSASGGAIYAASYSSMSFTAANNINFLNNNSGNGGAVGVNTSLYTSFVAGYNIIFNNNYANTYGGAVYGTSSSMSFTSGNDISFNNNYSSSTSSGGGAVYAASSSMLFRADNNISFNNNYSSGTSSGGGAIYAASYSTVSFTANNIIFENNRASGRGGAIALSSGLINFNAGASGLNLVFKNNSDMSGINDICFYNNSSIVNLNAGNYGIVLENGLKANGNGGIYGIINKTGNGSLTFGGDTVINIAQFNITGGNVIFLDSATFTGPSMVLPGTVLDLQNNTVNTIKAGVFTSTVSTKIDIFANGSCDLIIAGTATVGGNLDIKARVGKYENKEYEIILSTLTYVKGIFTSTSSNLKLQFGFNNYTSSNSVILIVNGIFTADELLDLEGLSFNQKETAKAFSKLSIDDAISEDMADVITDILSQDEPGQRDSLAQASGYFLSNIVRNFAADSPNNEIYDKIRNHSRYNDDPNSGIWIQVKGGAETFGENDNSPEDYENNTMGVLAGFDRISDSGLMLGVFLRFNQENVTQGNNSAEGTKKGLGLYGGYIQEGWEIKAMLLGSFDNYSTERYMPVYDRTAKGELESMTISADIEGALNIVLSENTKLKPYAGIESGNVNFQDFKETGAGALNLEVTGDSYIRNAARFGMGIEYGHAEWNIYAKGEGKYLITGYEPELESVFEGTDVAFKSRGAQEGALQIGFMLGGEVFINESWKVFANMNYYTAASYGNIYGNVGVRYVIGNAENKQDRFEKEEKIRKAEESRIAEIKEKVKKAEEARFAEIKEKMRKAEEAKRLKKEEAKKVTKEEAIRLEKEAAAKKAAEEEAKRLEREEKIRKAEETNRLEKEEEARKAKETKILEKEEKIKKAEEVKRLENEKKTNKAAEKEAERLEKEEKIKEEKEAKRLEKEEKIRKAEEYKRLKKEEAADKAAEKEAERFEKEEKIRKAEEYKRLKKEEEANKAAEKEAERLEKEEKIRKAEEYKRLKKEEEANKAAEEEAKRLEREERIRKAEEARRIEKEKSMKAAEEEAKRLEADKATEEEANRLEKEEKIRKTEEAIRLKKEEAKKAMEEAKRLEKEAKIKEAEEAKRLKEEEEAKKSTEKEAKRLEKEAKIKEAEEARRLKKEEEARKIAEEEAIRLEREERIRKAEEARLAEREERIRKAEEARRLEKEAEEAESENIQDE